MVSTISILKEMSKCKLDTFFSGNNGARMISCGSNDLSVQAESNDTQYDHDIKFFGSRLGHYVPYASND